MSWNERPTHYTDWEIMLECEELDLVFVSSLPIYHFSMVKAAMERDIHVVCIGGKFNRHKLVRVASHYMIT